MIGNALYSKLTTATAVAALIGTRVYPHEAPPRGKTYPMIVYKPGEPDLFRHQGGTFSLCRQSVTLAIIATTYDGLQALVDATIAALDGQRGTWAGVRVQGCFLDSDGSEEIEVTHPDDTYWVAELPFDVLYNRT